MLLYIGVIKHGLLGMDWISAVQPVFYYQDNHITPTPNLNISTSTSLSSSSSSSSSSSNHPENFNGLANFNSLYSGIPNTNSNSFISL